MDQQVLLGKWWWKHVQGEGGERELCEGWEGGVSSQAFPRLTVIIFHLVLHTYTFLLIASHAHHPTTTHTLRHRSVPLKR